MTTPILTITDGTTRVNLLVRDSGIGVCDYTPARQTFKNDGVWADSSIADGRQLQMRKWTNIIDVFTITISGGSQNQIISDARALTALLEKAVQYWVTEWQNEPVWIERRGTCEDNLSYSLIHSYKWASDDSPFEAPFGGITQPLAMADIDLVVEHGPWLSNPPGEGDCVELSNLMNPGAIVTTTDSPTAQDDDAYVQYNDVEDISVYPTASSDDAYVAINATDSQIVMVDAGTPTDDATITHSTANINTGGNYLNLDGTDKEIGVKFNGVNIPNGATIVTARLDMFIYNPPDRMKVDIYGELNAAPNTFSTYANFTGRGRTVASVYWYNYEATTGKYIFSPDIATIIQEIVNLGGWASGNDLVLFLDGRSGADGQYYSADWGSGVQPRLYVKWEIADYIDTTSVSLKTGVDNLSSYDEFESGIRFRNLTIPFGSVIKSAKLYTTKASSLTTLFDIDISAEANVAPAAFSTYANFVGRAKTTNSVEWYKAPVEPIGTEIESPDLKNVVQEVVDTVGWASGNDLVLFLTGIQYGAHLGTWYWSYYSFDNASDYPRLEIEFEEPDAIDTSATHLTVGEQSSEDNAFGVRFRSVAVPNGAYIDSAKATFDVVSQTDGDDVVIDITGEDNAAPAIFSTYADFAGRTQTSALVSWNGNTWAAGASVSTPDISSIIQEIVNLPGWASGNDLVLFFYPQTGSDGVINFASFDHASYDEAELEIDYIEIASDEIGRSATCLDEVYVVNKDNKAGIDAAFSYDLSVPSYTSLIGSALPYSVLPAVTAVGDILYLGSTVGPFSNVVFNFSTSSAGMAIDWEYWNGAWVALTVVTDKADYDNFNVSGTGCLVWEQPTDWTTSAVNAVNAYWIRGVVTAGVVPPVQASRDIYTIIKSSVDISSADVGGDITAIAKINTVTLDTTRGEAQKVIVGLRSKSRGENFAQHINTNGQNGVGITTTADVLTAAQANIDSPTGNVMRTSFVGSDVMARRLYFDFSTPTSLSYYGRYRAFVRAKETTAITVLAEGDIRSYLSISMGSSTNTKTAESISIGDDWYYFDYGIITIPPSLLPEIYEGTIRLSVYAQNDNANAAHFEWVDLVLVPVDEYAMEIRQDASAISNIGDITTADSLSYMGKSPVFSVLRKEADFGIYDIPTVISSGPIQLQANADQSLHFFVPDASKYEWVGRIQAWKNQRYLTFRGDR